jgi:DNA mismatch endonuclease (patch repair protein)
MTDVLTPEQRRLNMSRVRGRDTKPEMQLRRALHGRGLRFRLHRHDMPGRPDIVFPRHKAVVFVHGCFWHGHGCTLFKVPQTRRAFWLEKISRNRRRDDLSIRKLQAAGWRVLVVWECSLRGPSRLPLPFLCDQVQAFLTAPELSLRQIPAGGSSHGWKAS